MIGAQLELTEAKTHNKASVIKQFGIGVGTDRETIGSICQSLENMPYPRIHTTLKVYL